MFPVTRPFLVFPCNPISTVPLYPQYWCIYIVAVSTVLLYVHRCCTYSTAYLQYCNIYSTTVSTVPLHPQYCCIHSDSTAVSTILVYLQYFCIYSTAVSTLLYLQYCCIYSNATHVGTMNLSVGCVLRVGPPTWDRHIRCVDNLHVNSSPMCGARWDTWPRGNSHQSYTACTASHWHTSKLLHISTSYCPNYKCLHQFAGDTTIVFPVVFLQPHIKCLPTFCYGPRSYCGPRSQCGPEPCCCLGF